MKAVGRYAPSPTGPQHLGNLRTALLAWLHARLLGGDFLLRMEDLDKDREVEGSAEQILGDLEWMGLDWDGEVVSQLQRLERYEECFQHLQQNDLVYPCYCSRKDIQQAASAPHGGTTHIYPGTCRHLSRSQRVLKAQKKTPSWRLRVDGAVIDFDDLVFGAQKSNLETEVGDFVVKRADGVFAYQFAVSVDDHDQAITHVVRGEDLLESSARQVYIRRRLFANAAALLFVHVPLFHDEEGNRMAKRFGSTTLEAWCQQAESATRAGFVAHLAHSVGIALQHNRIEAKELLKECSEDDLLKALRLHSR